MSLTVAQKPTISRWRMTLGPAFRIKSTRRLSARLRLNSPVLRHIAVQTASIHRYLASRIAQNGETYRFFAAPWTGTICLFPTPDSCPAALVTSPQWAGNRYPQREETSPSSGQASLPKGALLPLRSPKEHPAQETRCRGLPRHHVGPARSERYPVVCRPPRRNRQAR